MRYLLIAALLAPSLLGAAYLAQPHTDCADTVANSFVFRETFDARATANDVLAGHARVVQRRDLGSGAWRCLATDKQRELSAAGIDGEAPLHAAILATGRAYERAAPLGLLAQVSEPPVHVYRLDRSVQTHDLVTDSGYLGRLSDWLKGIQARPRLEPVQRSETVLLLIQLDAQGKVARFGFVDSDE